MTEPNAPLDPQVEAGLQALVDMIVELAKGTQTAFNECEGAMLKIIETVGALAQRIALTESVVAAMISELQDIVPSLAKNISTLNDRIKPLENATLEALFNVSPSA